jgi:hypothetical protein
VNCQIAFPQQRRPSYWRLLSAVVALMAAAAALRPNPCRLEIHLGVSLLQQWRCEDQQPQAAAAAAQAPLAGAAPKLY